MTAELYDPRDEQVRAQRQGVYESLVRKRLGLPNKHPFRTTQGIRIDLRLSPADRKAAVSQAFAVGTKVPQKYGRLAPHGQQPTSLAAAESEARYRLPDKLLRNRQDYEETLGAARKLFYRVVAEPTSTGTSYFVWPMPPVCSRPVRAPSESEARRLADLLNQRRDPRSTGVWWHPPETRYTSESLAYWLPPRSVWGTR